MGRPDETVLLDIEGYKFKKARKKGDAFVMSPGGVNFSFDLEVMKKFINTVEKDAKLRKELGL